MSRFLLASPSSPTPNATPHPSRVIIISLPLLLDPTLFGPPSLSFFDKLDCLVRPYRPYQVICLKLASSGPPNPSLLHTHAHIHLHVVSASVHTPSAPRQTPLSSPLPIPRLHSFLPRSQVSRKGASHCAQVLRCTDVAPTPWYLRRRGCTTCYVLCAFRSSDCRAPAAQQDVRLAWCPNLANSPLLLTAAVGATSKSSSTRCCTL
ncbi:hypothetical protein EI94DRAFT_676626 [Lactarius quietus]|nr:hypothetical protein EI94DRAFT_676626 [Lactarius quietus]